MRNVIKYFGESTNNTLLDIESDHQVFIYFSSISFRIFLNDIVDKRPCHQNNVTKSNLKDMPTKIKARNLIINSELKKYHRNVLKGGGDGYIRGVVSANR